MATATAIDRIAPTRRPTQKVIGFQCWSDLLFVHWRIPAEQLQTLVPAELTIDTFDGDAWVGLVPFAMSGIRPWWSPAVPGVSTFLETNVRTYVHRDGGDPGVWFFSLDASKSLAVRVARFKWGLPYFRSNMRLARTGDRIRYGSSRLWPGEPGAGLEIEAEIGDLIGGDDRGGLPAGQAEPGSLEHFLAERYILFSHTVGGPLKIGRVHHSPYPLRSATLVSCDESLLAAAGISVGDEPAHVLFSDGVSVDIHGLLPVA